MSADRKVTLTLTRFEALQLHYAADSIADEIDSYGLTAAQKAAWRRAMAKLLKAVRDA